MEGEMTEDCRLGPRRISHAGCPDVARTMNPLRVEKTLMGRGVGSDAPLPVVLVGHLTLGWLQRVLCYVGTYVRDMRQGSLNRTSPCTKQTFRIGAVLCSSVTNAAADCHAAGTCRNVARSCW